MGKDIGLDPASFKRWNAIVAQRLVILQRCVNRATGSQKIQIILKHQLKIRYTLFTLSKQPQDPIMVEVTVNRVPIQLELDTFAAVHYKATFHRL